ncbi:MAG: hypothetical protein HWQ41_10315 [Nostoc sp. NOS(2021)]|uniref:hypothetical protein n=1 Tax=Nostoc sp. NOS(2021) TaxID=2815407 RepID=UPI0025DE3D61|nr:hypothetical protein [Nostoc sp. NOS(2021)]MBN3895639.1 hypothetical protein [Nostoc sp. NOS(2021)]
MNCPYVIFTPMSIGLEACNTKNRGFGISARHHIDEDGVITGTVTDELAIRGYYQEWNRLMKANFKLTAQAVELD